MYDRRHWDRHVATALPGFIVRGANVRYVRDKNLALISVVDEPADRLARQRLGVG